MKHFERGDLEKLLKTHKKKQLLVEENTVGRAAGASSTTPGLMKKASWFLKSSQPNEREKRAFKNFLSEEKVCLDEAVQVEHIRLTLG